MRRVNNDIKRDFIQKWVQKGSKVLDAGCGQGGDIHKWNSLGVELVGFDPNIAAIQEARLRSSQKRWKVEPRFLVGTIENAPLEKFDVVCYNFSFHYQDEAKYSEILKRLKSGGLLIGIVPDPERFHLGQENGISIDYVTKDIISVYIPDTPYYKYGPITEPVVEKEKVTENLKPMKFISWGDSFSIYSKFVFQM
jgi:SAM-dependent methyltransferase